MRPVSFAVLAVAALLTSPALGAAAIGDLPVDVALTRYLMATGLCWLLLSVASEWLRPAAAPAPQSPSQSSTPPPEAAAGSTPPGAASDPGQSADAVPASNGA